MLRADRVCLDTVGENQQEDLEHWRHGQRAPKYVRSDYSQANRPSNKACYEQIWSQGWQQLHTPGWRLTKAGVVVV